MNNSFTKLTIDRRGIPIVQPSPSRSSSSSSHRSKSRTVVHGNDSQEIADEIQLCKVPPTTSNSKDGVPQRTPLEYFGRVYQHSPTRTTASSPRIHSDSWQDASTEPMTPYNHTGDKVTPNEPETPNSPIVFSPKRRTVPTSRIDRLFASSPNPIEAPSSRTPKLLLSAVKPKVPTTNAVRNDIVNNHQTMKKNTEEIGPPNTNHKLLNSQEKTSVPDSSLTTTKVATVTTQSPPATTISQPAATQSTARISPADTTTAAIIPSKPTSTKRRFVHGWNDDESSTPKSQRTKSKDKEPEKKEAAATQNEPSAATIQSSKTNTISSPTVTSTQSATRISPATAATIMPPALSTKRKIVDDWNDDELPAPKVPRTNPQEKEPEATAEQPVTQNETPVDALSVKEPKVEDKEEGKSVTKQDDNKKPIDTTTTATTMGPPTNTRKQATKEEEAAKVAEEIAHLMKTVKCLPNYYKLLDKIGEGTFSTVYKALDVRRNFYRNDNWEPQLLTSPTSSDDEQPTSNKTLNEYVALKRIYDTSSPRRIANEIAILRKLKGSACISPLITAFRQQDQVFVVMPYIQHDDFKETFATMFMDDIKHYLRSMFTALHHLHRFSILHRDVKPNNFLYNRKKKTGYLIDFGLAESESDYKALEIYAAKMEAKVQNNHFYTTSKHVAQAQMTSSSSVLAALGNKENRSSSSTAAAATDTTTAEGNASRAGHRVMGYIKNDARHAVKASRAGTRGFRAPEILMRVTRQTCAIDIWSVGVIMLCLMTGRYPFFLANDESDSIIELAQIYGSVEMKKCAKKYKRIFSTNIDIPQHKISYAKICQFLNKDRVETWDKTDYRNGLDLLDKCLDLDHSTRITASKALDHPFLKFGEDKSQSSSADANNDRVNGGKSVETSDAGKTQQQE